MNQFLEAATIALHAIWSNKLRSFLTVLGNIVAVTSIIAVVSLIQGMNGYVTNAIVSDVGADNFTIQRMPVVRTQEDEDRVRNNPRITLRDAAAVRKFSENVGAVAGQGQAAARITYGGQDLDGAQIQGVTRDYIFFSTFTAEQGRLISPVEVESNRPVTVLGWDVADKLFGPVDPIDKIISIGRHHFRVVGVSKKKGSAFGNSQDNFAIVPLGSFQKLFGSRNPSLQLLVKPKSPELVAAAMDDATVAMRIERRLRPAERDNFGMFTSDTLLGLYHTATNGIFAVLIGVVAHVARRRRHRHHEHHADGRERTDQGDRPAESARRAPARHHLADPDRVGHPVDNGRPDRNALRLHPGGHRQQAHTAACRRPGVVGGDRNRDHRDRRVVLRPLPGDARGAPRPD